MAVLPVLICAAIALAIATGMLVIGVLVGPNRHSAVKQMPYESGMDPIHDTRRRFDVRFHVVAIVFLIFDVEVLFIYPWAVASHHPTAGIDQAVAAGWVSGRGVVFSGVMFFLALVVAGLIYEWRKGVLRWR
jgi:NADH-quinone oxidoreductase subunit A